MLPPASLLEARRLNFHLSLFRELLELLLHFQAEQNLFLRSLPFRKLVAVTNLAMRVPAVRPVYFAKSSDLTIAFAIDNRRRNINLISTLVPFQV